MVLGAGGFIGRALRRRLAGTREVRCFDQRWSEDDLEASSERHHTCDIATDDGIRAVLDASRDASGLVHLAAYYDFKNRPDPRYERIESGLQRLLERLKADAPPDMPFVYASSMANVKPTEPGRRLTEESPRWRPWAYPAHKMRCEELLEAATMPQPRCELVLAGVYSDWCELVPLYFQLERARQPSLHSNLYPGPTDRGLTYVHVDDVASAFEKALTILHGCSGLHRYLIGEDEPMTYAAIHGSARTAFGHEDAQLRRVPRLMAKAGAAVFRATGAERFVRPWMIDYAGEHFELDVSRAHRDLDWKAEHAISEQLAGICHRAREHPDKWRQLNEARPR